MGYAFKAKGRVFLPDGEAGMSEAEANEHNDRLEAAELAQWQTKPDRWQVYVTDANTVTTWRGVVLGAIIERTTYRHNFGGHMTAIRFRGTNGATYSGRFGSDWSQLCRVRRVGK